jgi:hypothetical protein
VTAYMHPCRVSFPVVEAVWQPYGQRWRCVCLPPGRTVLFPSMHVRDPPCNDTALAWRLKWYYISVGLDFT